MIKAISAHFPAVFRNYHEPFVGAGGMALGLGLNFRKRIVLADSNADLVGCYWSIEYQPDSLIHLCREHEANHSEAYYSIVREYDRLPKWEVVDPIHKSARLMYLNKAGFNGLYRVNSKGQFNVPHGNRESVKVCDAEGILAVHRFLQDKLVEVLHQDFEKVLVRAVRNDLVYMDPPYAPISKSSAFTGYGKDGFGEAEQIRLKGVCDRLSELGVYVAQSNSDTPFIRKLYSNWPYRIVEIEGVPRSISASVGGRQKVRELLILNY